MNRIISIYIFLSVLAIGVAAQSSVNVGQSAPTFAAISLDGTNYDLSELRGSVVVMTFWSTKCEICRSEIPKLNAFADRYDSKKVVFLALSMENEAKIAGYLRSNPFKFQIMPNSFGVLMQYANRSRDGFVDMGFPSFFVIDQQGTVQLKTSGYDKIPAIDATVNRLIVK